MTKKIFLLLALSGYPLLNASIISKTNINPNLAAIKVASLKSDDSINLFVNEYNNYDIFVKNTKEWKKLYVVNIPKNKEKVVLEDLKNYDKNIFFVNPKKELLKNLVSKEQINPNLAAIKVASFKSDSSVDSFINQYKQYDIYVQEQNGWKKIYIVNIPKVNEKKDFRKLQEFDKNIFYVDVNQILLKNDIKKITPIKEAIVQEKIKEEVIKSKPPEKEVLVQKESVPTKEPILVQNETISTKEVVTKTEEKPKEDELILIENMDNPAYLFESIDKQIHQLSVDTKNDLSKLNEEIKKRERTIYVEGFKFKGNTAVKTEELQKISEPYTKLNLTLKKLLELSAKITKYYQDKGYFLSKAYIPKQKMQNYEVEITIAEGKLGKFIIDNKSKIDTEKVSKFLNKDTQNVVVNTNDINTRVNKLNVFSGIKVLDTKLTPSKEEGKVDFIVTIEDSNKNNSYVAVDNYGSRYEGEYNLSLGTTINNLSNIGDTLALSGSISSSAKSKRFSTKYSRNIGTSGLSGGANFYINKYELENIPNYESLGDSSSIGLFLDYPLVSSNFNNTNLHGEYKFKKVKSDNGITNSTQLSDKELHLLELSLSEQRILNTTFPSNLYMSTSLTAGNLRLVSDLAKANDQFLDSEGFFSKINADINYNIAFSDKYSFLATLKGQKSLNKNLDASEDFIATGSSGVRAYEDSELNGDDGYFTSLELKYRLPKLYSVFHDASIFVEHAKVWKNNKVFNDEQNTRTLNAVGLGYNMNYSDLYFKASFAHGFGSDSSPLSESEFSTSKNKFLMQLYYPF
jgi:hemolysin activation/secretion protein